MKRFVLADDDPMFRGLLKRILEKDGFSVTTATNGREAMEAAIHEQPDMVLLDLDMPEMHGLDALHQLKARSDTAGIPIVVLTGVPSQQNVIEALKEGAQDFIAKTSDIENLLLRIQVNLSVKRKNTLDVSHSKPEAAVISTPEASKKNTADPPTSHPPVSEAEFEARLDKTEGIKALPFVASRIVKLTEDKNSDAAAVAKEIEKDLAIASKVLKIANSAYYGLQEQIVSLERAVVSMGVSEVRDIVLATAVVDLFAEPLAGSALDCVALWKHSFCCASYARRIAQQFELGRPETFFLSGLLHRLGMVVFDEIFHEEYAEVLIRTSNSMGDIRMHELNLLGHDHVDLTHRILEKWGITRHVRPLIGYGMSWIELMRLSQADKVEAGVLPICDMLTIARGMMPGAPEKMRPIPDALAMSLNLNGYLVGEVDNKIDQDMHDLWNVFFSDVPGMTAPSIDSQRPVGARNKILLIREIEPHLDIVEFWLRSRGYEIHTRKNFDFKETQGFDGMLVEISSLSYLKKLIEQVHPWEEELSSMPLRVILLAPPALKSAITALMPGGPRYPVFCDPYSQSDLVDALS